MTAEADTMSEASNTGLATLDWSRHPVPEDAWFDAVALKVTGDIEWGADYSFAEYVNTIAGGDLTPAKATPGRQYRSNLRDLVTFQGKLSVDMASPGRADARKPGTARFTFTLFLNPTKTRALSMRRLKTSLHAAYPRDFFAPLPTVAEVFNEGPPPIEVSLNGAENLLVGPEQLGGHTTTERMRSRDDYLHVFEAQLKRILLDALAPPFLDRQVGLDGCRAEVSPQFRVSLEWHKIIVQRAEVYWECATDAPLALVSKLADRGQQLARRISVGRHDGLYWESQRTETSTSFTVPLTGARNINLAVYSKTHKRVRFEVRYQRDFSRHLAGVKDMTSGRLPALLSRLADDAAKRIHLPWTALGLAATEPQDAEVGDLPDFINELVSATRHSPALLHHVLNGLMMSGGITADDDRYPGVAKVVGRLERRGVIVRTPLQLKELKHGRRYALTDRYSAVRRKMLRGFSPEVNQPRAVEDDYTPYPFDDGYGDELATKVATAPPRWDKLRR